MSNSNHLISITKYATLTKRKAVTIRLMCREGRIGAVKIGSKWMVDLSSNKTKNAVFLVRGRPFGTTPPKRNRRKKVA